MSLLSNWRWWWPIPVLEYQKEIRRSCSSRLAWSKKQLPSTQTALVLASTTAGSFVRRWAAKSGVSRMRGTRPSSFLSRRRRVRMWTRYRTSRKLSMSPTTLSARERSARSSRMLVRKRSICWRMTPSSPRSIRSKKLDSMATTTWKNRRNRSRTSCCETGLRKTPRRAADHLSWEIVSQLTWNRVD